MDVEKLAKELILKNMTPEQQMAVLDSVRQSVLQAKEVQKKKIGENVDLVVQALKKIESDIRSRFDDVGNAIEKRVASIQDGRDGSNGKDGRDGKDGKAGRDGAKGDKGDSGRDGRDGVDGVDGISVTSARIDFDGSLIITLSSGVELNVGEVVAPDLAERIKVITNGGGTSQSVLDTLASLQTQITNLIPSQTGNSGKYLTTNGTALSWASIAGGGLSYQGTWNASTNTPTLVSSTGVNGYYYITATAGSTNLDGITDWQIGDWLLFNGTVWQKIDQSNLVTSVAGRTGAVTLSNTDISGLGTMSTQNASSVAITGGTINGTTIGATTATTGAFTTLTVNDNATFGSSNTDTINFVGRINSDFDPATDNTYDLGRVGHEWRDLYIDGTANIDSLIADTADINAGTIDNTTIGATTPQNGSFVNLSVTGTTSFDGSQGTAGQVLTSAGTGATPTWTTPTTGTVTSVTGTSPIASSGGTTPDISLAASYGDTQNPYASKTAKFVLAAPNASAGVPTFRAIVASDIPTLNQNTTGTASNVTGTVAIANGGTGQTTANAAFNALAPSQTSNSGKYLTTNGTTTSWATVTATPASVSDQNNTSTGYFDLPTGTTAQRPASPVVGMIRYNTTESKYEVYDGTLWKIIATTLYPYSINYLIVAGGGGGGAGHAGGGGAGGLLSGSTTISSGTTYTITVGAGGAGGVNNTTVPANGTNSVFNSLTAIGGGYGGGNNQPSTATINGNSGGSGGGGANSVIGTGTGGAGTSGQGNAGGSGSGGANWAGGGGGGASAAGANNPTTQTGGAGGAGSASSITGSSVTYGGGGGGGGGSTAGGAGGAGGGGAGTIQGGGVGVAGTANTGGGGGGARDNNGGAGGSGVVILSVPTSTYSGVTTGSPTVTTSGSNTILKFTGSGSYTAGG